MSTSCLSAIQAHCQTITDEHARLIELLRDLRAMFFADPLHQRLLCEEHGIQWDDTGRWFLTLYPLMAADVDALLAEVSTEHDRELPGNSVNPNQIELSIEAQP